MWSRSSSVTPQRHDRAHELYRAQDHKAAWLLAGVHATADLCQRSPAGRCVGLHGPRRNRCRSKADGDQARLRLRLPYCRLGAADLCAELQHPNQWSQTTSCVRMLGATTRFDVVRQTLIDMINKASTSTNWPDEFKFSVHKFSNTATGVHPTSSDLASVKTAVQTMTPDVHGAGRTCASPLQQIRTKIPPVATQFGVIPQGLSSSSSPMCREQRSPELHNREEYSGLPLLGFVAPRALRDQST